MLFKVLSTALYFLQLGYSVQVPEDRLSFELQYGQQKFQYVSQPWGANPQQARYWYPVIYRVEDLNIPSNQAAHKRFPFNIGFNYDEEGRGEIYFRSFSPGMATQKIDLTTQVVNTYGLMSFTNPESRC